MAPERRLAAIMFTDIVGSTAVMAQSESAGLRAKARHREIVRPEVERYGGELIEDPGDQTLSIFRNALDAVNCALAIQEELHSGGDLKLHIGIHTSDILIQDGEISGDGVNIAARICAISEGDAPYISDEVRHAVQNQTHLQFEALGDQEFKNVPRPVPVFRVGGTAQAPRPLSPVWSRVQRRPGALVGAVAVLLFLGLGLWWVARPLPHAGPPLTSIAEAIRVELDVEEEWSLDRFARYGPQDVRAYEFVRKGIEAAVRDPFGLEGIQERLAYYEQALEIDPTYAAAHAFMGSTYVNLASASDGDRRPENLARARAAIQRARELDNEDRTALWASARLSIAESNWEEALSRHRQLLELYPRDSFLRSEYGRILATVGEFEEAFVQLQRAVELEDVLGLASLQLGLLYYFFYFPELSPRLEDAITKDDFDRALELLDRAIERQPGFESAMWWVFASSYHRKEWPQRPSRLRRVASRQRQNFPCAVGYENGGWEGMLRVALDLRLGGSELRCPEPRIDVMNLSAILGDRDRMFDCLELFIDPTYTWTWRSIFDPYREDPRFDALLRKWNLEDAPFASE